MLVADIFEAQGIFLIYSIGLATFIKPAARTNRARADAAIQSEIFIDKSLRG